MKQVYIIKKNNPKLLLFFAGWAADETPFKQYCPQGMDYMICYDYRTLDFDTSILEQYRQVNVVAWSMGVWAAPIALASVPKEKLLLIAFNGTITPIGDTDGIPEKTFRDTLSGLTPASLQKFMRRMCKDSNAYKAFLAITPRVSFLPGDAEALDFPRETDLITSCSTLQWFNDPGAFLTRCHQALVADGLLAFSTFGTTNMHEIRQLTGHGLDYLSVEELQALLSPHFDILHAEEEVVTLPFPTPQAVLKHLKQTGVTGTEKRIWTRSRLQSFCKEYTTRFSDAAGNVSLTYHPIYIIARKKTK